MIEALLIGLGALIGLVVLAICDRIEQRRQEKKHKPFIVHGCHDCKHTNKSYADEPCCYCDDCELWEDAEQ